jgi:hypothetical protein
MTEDPPLLGQISRTAASIETADPPDARHREKRESKVLVMARTPV